MPDMDFYNELKDEIMSQFSDEEKEGITADLQIVNKQNNQELIGLTIKENDSNVAPCIYLNDAKERFERGESMQTLASEIRRVYLDSLDMIPVAKSMEIDISDFDHLQDKICLKLLNVRENEAYLQDKPHLMVGSGLALCCEIRLRHTEGDLHTVAINNDLLERLSADRETLFQTAMQHAWENSGPTLISMQQGLMGAFGTSHNLLEHPEETIAPEDKEPMYVLSNQDSMLGASSLFYPQMQERIAAVLGEGYYALPSSVHEYIIVPQSQGIDPQDMCSMVKEANVSVIEPKDFLSDHVFHYDQDAGELRMVVSEKQPFTMTLMDLSNPEMNIENRQEAGFAIRQSMVQAFEGTIDRMSENGVTQIAAGKLIEKIKREVSDDPKLADSIEFLAKADPYLSEKLETGSMLSISEDGRKELSGHLKDALDLNRHRDISRQKSRDEEIE